MDNQNSVPPAAPKAEHDHTLMGILAYLGFLIIIPFLVAKNEPFVKFHIKQGLVLLIIEVILWILTPMFLWNVWVLVRLVNLALIILAIIGIVNVVQKKEKMLPVVGGLARHFKF